MTEFAEVFVIGTEHTVDGETREGENGFRPGQLTIAASQFSSVELKNVYENRLDRPPERAMEPLRVVTVAVVVKYVRSGAECQSTVQFQACAKEKAYELYDAISKLVRINSSWHKPI